MFRQGPMYSISSFPTAGDSFPQAKLPPENPWTADLIGTICFSEPTHCLVTSGILWTVSPTERWSLELSKFEYWIFFSCFCCCSYWTSYFLGGMHRENAEPGAQDDNHPERHNYMVLNPQSGAGPTVESVSGSLEETLEIEGIVKCPDRLEETHEDIYEICIYIFLICTHIFHYD